MSKLLISGIIVIGSMFLACGGASASTYIGGGLGNATWDLEPSPFGDYELEDGIALRIFGGIRSDNIGGEIELSFSSHDWKGYPGEATHNAAHIIFSGVGYLPATSNIDVYGKIGFNMWGTTVDFGGDTYDGDDGIDLAYGFGLNFKATEQFLIRLEYQSLPGLGDGIDSGDVEQYTVNFALNY